MRIVIVLPSHLHTAITHRLSAFFGSDTEILLLSSDCAQPIPELQKNDALLIIQCRDFRFAQAAAAQVTAKGIHYAEIALHESPFAQQYGFMIAAGGIAADLHTLAPVLDALAPQANAWWHVGHAGSASFLSGILSQLIALTQQQIDFSALFLHLQKLSVQQAYAGQLAQHYLDSTADEVFMPAHTQQSIKPLASFLEDKQSPARQIAQILVHSANLKTNQACT